MGGERWKEICRQFRKFPFCEKVAVTNIVLELKKLELYINNILRKAEEQKRFLHNTF